MKMKLNALSLAVAAGFIGSAAHAADAAFFPYVGNSATVSTIVSIVDAGTAATLRYVAGTTTGDFTTGKSLHWRLNYKAGASVDNLTASCAEVDWNLPTSPNDIQSVDISGKLGAATKNVLFNDPSIRNNWNAVVTSSQPFKIADVALLGANRANLIVHNADDATNSGATVQGEALILEHATGAAWGYQAVATDGDDTTANSGFYFTRAATTTVGGVANGILGTRPAGLVTLLPLSESVTRFFVTPMPYNTTATTPHYSLLGVHGDSDTLVGYGADNTIGGTDDVTGQMWDKLRTQVSFSTDGRLGYDRDENLISGSVPVAVQCVGAVDATTLISTGASGAFRDGGWARLRIEQPTGTTPGTLTSAGYYPTQNAYVTKLEYNVTGKLNGETIPGTFNNGYILR